MQNIEQQNSRDWLVIMPRYISYSALLYCFHITCYQHVDIYSKRKFPTWDKIKPMVFKGGDGRGGGTIFLNVFFSALNGDFYRPIKYHIFSYFSSRLKPFLLIYKKLEEPSVVQKVILFVALIRV